MIDNTALDRRDYTEFEWQLFDKGDRTSWEIELSWPQADALIASGCYRLSTGYPYEATQYRRSNADGSCLHLVFAANVPRLHRDAYDPHASPMSLYMHLTNEARFEVAATCALGWSLIRLLAR